MADYPRRDRRALASIGRRQAAASYRRRSAGARDLPWPGGPVPCPWLARSEIARDHRDTAAAVYGPSTSAPGKSETEFPHERMIGGWVWLVRDFGVVKGVVVTWV